MFSAKVKTCIAGILISQSTWLMAGASHDDTQSNSTHLAIHTRAQLILDQIELPSIPQREVAITEFGATLGQDANSAINRAITETSHSGGGKVIVPAGLWLSHGPIRLKSGIELHLAEGATLRFSTEPEHYLPAVLTRWEGTEVYSYSPLIYAFEVHDVAITGKGTIDGNSESQFHRFRQFERKSQQELRLEGIKANPVSERQFHEGHYLRPSLIQFFRAERVLLQGYITKNSPFWVNHLVYSNHVTVDGITVDSHWPNNDGIDVESSSYVVVKDSTFDTGDDAVVIKSGRDVDGRNIGIPSQHVVVKNNIMAGEDGIAVGSEMSGGISDVYFLDNTFDSGDSALRFKSNLDRGGLVHDVFVSGMQVGEYKNLFWFQLNYPGLLDGTAPPVYKDIVIENVEAIRAENFLQISSAAGYPIQNISLRNINVRDVDNALSLDNVQNLMLDGVTAGKHSLSGQFSWLVNQ